jgi:asparagine synthase (glutamine-hydrolysing)
MCGITGYWTAKPGGGTVPALHEALQRLSHRGPDDRGEERFVGPWGEVVLGHTRLSIIDLSAGGHQPMRSADGRYAIVFNGEIYNYRELRVELTALGHRFRSQSDTEVLLAAWSSWDRACLRRLTGMFAFVVLDCIEQTLTCVRDAFGIKPLFIARPSWGFCFASELPATVALRGEGAELDLQRCCDYLLHGDYDSRETTFIDGISQLPPGTYRVLSLRSGRLDDPVCWWTPPTEEAPQRSFEDAAANLRALFLDSVRHHLRSDVPLGAALSGGIDSSAVVCAMRAVEPDAPIHTFSFIADGTTVSEAPWADLVNRHVGATAHSVVVEPHELARDLDDMIVAQGEPFGSTSIYAQYRVFRLAREHGVTVTLDGQGADELLAGYHGYPGERVRSLLDDGALLPAAAFLLRWRQWPGRSLRTGLRASVAQFVGTPGYSTLRALAGRRVPLDWLDTGQLHERGITLDFPRQVPSSGRRRRLAAELALSATRRGLPALLRHADRNSMRFSVESRVPFLTSALAEFLFTLPESYLVSPSGETKRIFRTAMRGLVPDAILDRRDKIGFATPEREWLTALAPNARAWLGDADGIDFLRPAVMHRRFEQMLEAQLPFSWQAWRWINFCRWHVRVFRPMQATAAPRMAVA